MSCGPSGEREASKTMSRGEFLEVGAAAAALGTMGVSMKGGRTLSATTAMSDSTQCAPGSCEWGNRNLAWCIPAGILNSLWSDFFPRLVAVSWHDAIVTPSDKYLQSDDPRPLQRGTTSTGLLHLLLWLKVKMDSDEDPGRRAPTSLKKRLCAVIKFFNAHLSETGHPFPIVVAGQGGYDFLLSDWGIEMFLPDPPSNTDELLRYYAFRQTGRPSLGIPSYLADAVSLVSIDAPTGPSQIEADPLDLAFALGLNPSCPLAPQLLERWGVTPTQWSAISARVQEWLGATPGTLDPESLVEAPEPDAVLSRLLADNRAWEVVPDWRRAFGRDSPPSVRINFDEYVCAMRASRCWVVAGAVYRGFATELPRIVADAWMDSSILSKFRQADDDGLRQLFRDRLETMLPRPGRMAFQVQGTPSLSSPPGTPATPRWNGEDVMITDQGFYFPNPSDTPPDLEDMLKEIAGGRAGNPVFTDSKRPDGEE